jgi:hypothetical protein
VDTSAAHKDPWDTQADEAFIYEAIPTPRGKQRTGSLNEVEPVNVAVGPSPPSEVSERLAAPVESPLHARAVWTKAPVERTEFCTGETSSSPQFQRVCPTEGWRSPEGKFTTPKGTRARCDVSRRWLHGLT